MCGSQNERLFRRLIIWVLPLTLLLALPQLLESWKWGAVHVFVKPAAVLSGVLLGCPVEATGAGSWLLRPTFGNGLEVTTQCSGIGFFALLIVLTLWRGLYAGQWRRTLLFLVAAYPVAVLVNACRVSASAMAGCVSDAFLGQHYSDISHMTLGAIIFLFSLYLFNLALWHANDRRTPAPDSDPET